MTIKKEKTYNAIKVLEKISGGPLTLAEVIRSTRLCDEITQVDFAKKLGMSRQQLCDIEKGRKLVSAKLAAVYAKKLCASEVQYVRLAIQDQLRSAGLDYEVEIRKAA